MIVALRTELSHELKYFPLGIPDFLPPTPKTYSNFLPGNYLSSSFSLYMVPVRLFRPPGP